MSRRSQKFPSYSHHKASGQAIVRLDCVDHYLGPYGSEESHERYERAIAEWRLRRQEATPLKSGNLPCPLASPLTVNELILR